MRKCVCVCVCVLRLPVNAANADVIIKLSFITSLTLCCVRNLSRFSFLSLSSSHTQIPYMGLRKKIDDLLLGSVRYSSSNNSDGKDIMCRAGAGIEAAKLSTGNSTTELKNLTGESL